MRLLILFIVGLFFLSEPTAGGRIPEEKQPIEIPAQGQTEKNNPFIEWLAGLIGSTSTPPPEVLTPPDSCPMCKCGRTNRLTRIVGGQETQVNQYPWMAMLQYSGTFYCGGSLISDRHVLTAAHCVHGFNRNKISVVLMEHDRVSTTESMTMVSQVLRVIEHNGYNSNNYNSDIAILRLATAMTINDKLRPVCLPTAKKPFSGYDGIVTGWGATSENGAISTNLQEVTVPIMSNSDCRKTGYGPTRITDNMLCAGFDEGKKDSCQGDSGGPLHVINQNSTDNVHQIAGIVSWGEGCAKPNYPGVYTRVNRFGTWIRSNTVDGCYCTLVVSLVKAYPPLRRHFLKLEALFKMGSILFLVQTSRMKHLYQQTGFRPVLSQAPLCHPSLRSVHQIVPWYYGQNVGTGTLINDRVVLTSGTIVSSMIVFNQIKVIFGAFEPNSTAEGTTRKMFAVTKTKLHPQYSAINLLSYNIGLIQLAVPVTITDNFMPICLPSRMNTFSNTEATLVGWGARELGGQSWQTLRELTIPLYSFDECRLAFPNSTENNICGGVFGPAPKDQHKTSCDGDEGAGLMYPWPNDPSFTMLIGITLQISGVGCGRTNEPAVFTTLYPFIPWVQRQSSGCYSSSEASTDTTGTSSSTEQSTTGSSTTTTTTVPTPSSSGFFPLVSFVNNSQSLLNSSALVQAITSQLGTNLPSGFPTFFLPRPNRNNEASDSESPDINDPQPDIARANDVPVPVPPTCSACVNSCAFRPFQGQRIAGGSNVSPRNKYPFVALLTYLNSPSGQGSLINDRTIITTATIIENMPVIMHIRALLGVYNRADSSESISTNMINKVYIHPGYRRTNQFADNIGLLILKTPLTRFQPICLPARVLEDPPVPKATVIGWGATVPNGPLSNFLQEGELQMYPPLVCQLASPQASPQNLCGGPSQFFANIVSICKGDGGDPLVVQNDVYRELIGVALDIPGFECSNPRQPSMFTSVVPYLAWITAYGPGCVCYSG
uniref:Peptidase S1 domain-containing protein n=1 Tax=Anopheles christyi TaxID=43041 RepID=A0A182JXD4_9DIPT